MRAGIVLIALLASGLPFLVIDNSRLAADWNHDFNAATQQTATANAGSVVGPRPGPNARSEGLIFNIKSSPYSASMNGSDDTNAIDQAQKDARAVGGTVYIPPGVAVYSGHLTGVSISGAGPGISVLRRKTGNKAVLVDLSPRIGLSITDLTIDGNASGNSANTAPDVALGTNCLMQRVEVRNCPFMCIQAVGTHIEILDSTLIGPNRRGLGAQYGIWAADTATTLLIKGCTIRGMRLAGIFGSGARTRIEASAIYRNHWEVSPTGGGQIAFRNDGRNITITGNLISTGGGPLTSGIEMDAPDALIVGNTIEGQPNYGVIFQAAQGGSAIGNSISACGNAAIRVDSGASNVSLVGNMLRGSSTLISDTGIGTQKIANQPAQYLLLPGYASIPASSTTSRQPQMYVKGDKIVIQYNDEGTIRYLSMNARQSVRTAWLSSTIPP